MCKCRGQTVQRTSAPGVGMVETASTSSRFSVRCLNPSDVMRGPSGIVYPLSTGDYYSLSGVDIYYFQQLGYQFEFESAEDEKQFYSRFQ